MFQDWTPPAQGSPNRLVVARSTDGGVTWPQVAVVIDDSISTNLFEDKPQITVDNRGGTGDGMIFTSRCAVLYLRAR
jgi:hypothetical protein